MKLLKKTLLCCLMLLLIGLSVHPCSMFRLTVNGKTLIGNNEDYINPNLYLWTVPPRAKRFGIVYFGFDDHFPQGGMNEKGLVFDGFAMPYLKISYTEKQKRISPQKLMRRVMSSCERISEVRTLLEKHDLSFLEKAQLMFADREGRSLLVEGQRFIESDAPFQLSTNFYQSLVKGNDISCPRYLKGRKMLSDSPEGTPGFVRSVLDAMHQSDYWGGTLYSNVYDPEKGTIYLYLFANFNEAVTLKMDELLSGGKKRISLETLFKDKDRFLKYKQNYNRSNSLFRTLNRSESIKKLRDAAVEAKAIPQMKRYYSQLTKRAFTLLKKHVYDKSAILFELLAGQFPKQWQLHMGYANALWKMGKKQKAIDCLKQGIKLNPEQMELKRQLEKIEKKL